MLESLKKKALDKGIYTGIMLTDVSRAFDCISHDFQIGKLNAHGFTSKAMEIINDYLYESTKIGDNSSLWCDNLWCTTRFYIGTSPLNIYTNEIFLFSEGFNFADDCSPYEISDYIDVTRK